MHTDAKYLRKIPLPVISEELLNQIVILVTKLEQENYMTDTWFYYLKELNNEIYNAFCLQDDEVKYIEKEMMFIQSKKWSNELCKKESQLSIW